MANLQTLIPYLEQGYTLQCANGETLTPQSSREVQWQRPETKERYFWPKDYSLNEVRAMRPIWDYGVVFLDENKHPLVITRLEAIEQAVQEKRPHATFGKEPK
jgi:hypothetical protein